MNNKLLLGLTQPFRKPQRSHKDQTCQRGVKMLQCLCLIRFISSPLQPILVQQASINCWNAGRNDSAVGYQVTRHKFLAKSRASRRSTSDNVTLHQTAKTAFDSQGSVKHTTCKNHFCQPPLLILLVVHHWGLCVRKIFINSSLPSCPWSVVLTTSMTAGII